MSRSAPNASDATSASDSPHPPPPPVVYLGFALEYACDFAKWPSSVRSRFLPSDFDETTQAFIDRAIAHRPGRLRTLVRNGISQFVSGFDANALTGMYPMFLLGQGQWRTLFRAAGLETSELSHLDVGAGNGDITRELAPLFATTRTTETSLGMVRELRRRGFDCFRTDVGRTLPQGAPFDVVTCLNVLDRCARPHSLLRGLRRSARAHGLVTLSAPLPLKPWYFSGPRAHNPEQSLECPSSDWETAAAWMLSDLLPSVGLEVVVFSRVPYLSGGDARGSLYVLDAGVFVCRVKNVNFG